MEMRNRELSGAQVILLGALPFGLLTLGMAALNPEISPIAGIPLGALSILAFVRWLNRRDEKSPPLPP